MLRLSAAAAAPLPLLVALGLATLLVAAFCLTARLDARRRLAFAGAAQVGLIVFAFGLGDPAASFAGLLLMTMLSLLRAAAPPALAAGPTREAAWTRTATVLALAGLPMVALVLLAGPAAACAPWLLLPLGAGVLLATSSLIGAASPPPAARDDDDRWATALGPVPVWLNLAVVMLLAAAMPGPAAVWFRAVVALR
jgi:hydrogenase-4 component F